MCFKIFGNSVESSSIKIYFPKPASSSLTVKLSLSQLLVEVVFINISRWCLSLSQPGKQPSALICLVVLWLGWPLGVLPKLCLGLYILLVSAARWLQMTVLCSQKNSEQNWFYFVFFLLSDDALHAHFIASPIESVKPLAPIFLSPVSHFKWLLLQRFCVCE